MEKHEEAKKIIMEEIDKKRKEPDGAIARLANIDSCIKKLENKEEEIEMTFYNLEVTFHNEN